MENDPWLEILDNKHMLDFMHFMISLAIERDNFRIKTGIEQKCGK